MRAKVSLDVGETTTMTNIRIPMTIDSMQRRNARRRSTLCWAAVCLAACGQLSVTAHASSAKRVIVMVADGLGFNSVAATRYYRGAPAVYESFDYQLGMQTNSANNPNGYDPDLFWDSEPYNNGGATGSASAATAMFAGQKTLNGRLNISADGEPITNFFEEVAAAGMSIGAVSSVEISHATPAAVYAHNSSRFNYAAIAVEGIYGSNPLEDLPNNSSRPQAGDNNNYDAMNYHGNLTVLMGAGHGDYDSNGNMNERQTNRWAGGDAAWADIIDGSPPNDWTFIDEKADFEAIAAGQNVPEKLLGIAQANTTLQYHRGNTPADSNNPSGVAFNPNVPTLATMSTAALNVLSQNEDGFAVMIEGGAIDWAGHANNLPRLIEEHIDFDDAVQATVGWINAHDPTWSETLLVVVSDHETGDLWGPGGDFDPVVDNGVGMLPGHSWQSGNHTNSLVPLYARGAGAERFASKIIGVDENMVAGYGLENSGFDGSYIDNTAIYDVMKHAVFVSAGDLNGDGDLNAADIDMLTAALRAGSTDMQFDLDGSLAVDNGDVTYLVETLLGTDFGDANLDGSVTASGDAALLLANLDGVQGNKGWADADFDGDQQVTASADGGVLLENLGNDSAAVPELTSLILSLTSLTLLLCRRRAP